MPPQFVMISTICKKSEPRVKKVQTLAREYGINCHYKKETSHRVGVKKKIEILSAISRSLRIPSMVSGCMLPLLFFPLMLLQNTFHPLQQQKTKKL